MRSHARFALAPALPSAVTVALGIAATVAAGGLLGGCRRGSETPVAPDTPAAPIDPRDVRCVERPEGCIFCDGRGAPPLLLEPEQAPSSLCDPKDAENCVDFCSRLAPDCATPWFHGTSCLFETEEDFRREIFHRDTADRPQVQLTGRITDDAGRRVEGAKVRVWFQGTAIVDDVSGKDGGFHARLPVVPTPYTIRISHPGQATDIADLRVDRPLLAVRQFRLGNETTFKGRVVDSIGAAVPGVTIKALRTPEDVMEVSATQSGDDGQFLISGLENRRYVFVASRFGWLPSALRVQVAPGVPRVTIRLSRTGLIRGAVVDTDGDTVAHAIVVAMLSGGLGVASSPIIWTTDADGRFAQDRFGPGTYYLWARHGEMLVYPPEKIELAEGHLDVETSLKVSHRGARVLGRVELSRGPPFDPETRAVLVGRSPLAFPRKAVGDIDKTGAFVILGVLPGRYELSVRVGARALSIISGPREVEVPIEEGATVDLPEAVVVRPKAEE